MHFWHFKCIIITNMQSLVVFVTIFGLGLAAIRPAPYRASSHSSDEKSAEVLKSFSDISPDGGYQWSYETSNGIAADEQGHLTGNAKEPSVQAQGSYSYTAPDGTPIQVTYVADENGFQPSGAHLPVPPPIPEAILRSLAWNEKHPEQQQTLSFTGKQKKFY